MESGRITGGSVSFMKRKQVSQYEPEEASCRLDFSIPEGCNDYGNTLNTAEIEAKLSVMNQLGIVKREEIARPLAKTRSSLEADIVAGKSPKPAHRKSAQIEALDGAVTTIASATDVKPASDTTAGSTDDPLAPAAGETATAGTSAVVVAGEDPLAPSAVIASDTTASTASTADPFTAQREVTDADLATAAAKKNEALVKVHKEAGTLKIRDLVGQFMPPGKTLRELPQADRPAFLAKLEALV